MSQHCKGEIVPYMFRSGGIVLQVCFTGMFHGISKYKDATSAYKHLLSRF